MGLGHGFIRLHGFGTDSTSRRSGCSAWDFGRTSYLDVDGSLSVRFLVPQAWQVFLIWCGWEGSAGSGGETEGEGGRQRGRQRRQTKRRQGTQPHAASRITQPRAFFLFFFLRVEISENAAGERGRKR